ncbi:MAG: glucose 1-dehydrogenase [Deltaproteobacteria bacterium]|nr:glucose 1-dehydrogenase [Deltaproteobacteria bacterium]
MNDPSASCFRLDDRVALVTGATRGIGAAIARELAFAGARVVLTGRDDARAANAAAALSAEGVHAIGMGYDARLPGEAERLADRVQTELGRLDVLVNNAAVLRPHVIAKLKEEEFDELFQVNVKSALFLTKALRPLLEASAHGVVLNITAAGAQAPMAGIGAYCASKAALVNLTRTLAKEWTPLGIRVNALTPGSTATDMILPVDPEKRARFVAEMASQNPMNRIAEPVEIARAARFLVSDAASYVTGHVLVVDGGLLA